MEISIISFIIGVLMTVEKISLLLPLQLAHVVCMQLPPPQPNQSNFLYFMKFSGKYSLIIGCRIPWVWRPLWEILDLTLVDLCVCVCVCVCVCKETFNFETLPFSIDCKFSTFIFSA